jgi:hypothetical protein
MVADRSEENISTLTHSTLSGKPLAVAKDEALLAVTFQAAFEPPFVNFAPELWAPGHVRHLSFPLLSLQSVPQPFRPGPLQPDAGAGRPHSHRSSGGALGLHARGSIQHLRPEVLPPRVLPRAWSPPPETTWRAEAGGVHAWAGLPGGAPAAAEIAVPGEF